MVWAIGGELAHAQSAEVTMVAIDSLRVRPVLLKLWKESVRANKELVACLGGYKDGDVFWITRAADLYSRIPRTGTLANDPELDSDSVSVSRYLSEASVEACGPPQWVGTVHTHRIEGETEFPRPSSTDRAVISLWHGRWRHESVFCVLFSEGKPPWCEYQPGA